MLGQLLIFPIASSLLWEASGFGLRQSSTHGEIRRSDEANVDTPISRQLTSNRRTGLMNWNSDWIEPRGLVQQRHVPTDNMVGFEDLWWRAEQDSTYKAPVARDDFKLLVGVFSVSDEKDVRDVARRTWMNHSWICSTGAVDAKGCAAHVTFVLGKVQMSARKELLAAEDDLTFLDVRENMDDGKTAVWFHQALKLFPWATHIAKMDTDAFPHFDVLLNRMPAFGKSIVAGSACPNFYAGAFWSCNQADDSICPPGGCRYPVGNNFLQYEAENPECWSYMQGAFYILSRELVHAVNEDGDWKKHENKGQPEDAVTGLAIMRFAKKTGSCVGTVDMAGAFHHLGDRKSVV